MDEDVVNAIDALREAGIKIVLLTNNYYLDRSRLKRRLPSDCSRFDVIVESCVEGTMKPDPKLYQVSYFKQPILQMVMFSFRLLLITLIYVEMNACSSTPTNPTSMQQSSSE